MIVANLVFDAHGTDEPITKLEAIGSERSPNVLTTEIPRGGLSLRMNDLGHQRNGGEVTLWFYHLRINALLVQHTLQTFHWFLGA